MQLRPDLVSSGVAAVVVVFISLCIEFCGAKVGGILSSIPHVAVVGAVGLHASHSISDYRLAMLGMPIGMLASSFLLATVVVCSLTLPEKHAGIERVIFTFFIATLIFGAVLMVLLWVFNVCRGVEAGAWCVSIGCWVLELLIGLQLSRLTPAPDGKSKCRTWDILLRAAITFGIFKLAFWLASVSPALGGAMVNSPITLIVALVGIWLAQREKVAIGACGPMTLGTLSASAFALLGAWLIPDYSLAFGVGVSWVAAIMFTTVPQVILAREKKLVMEMEELSRNDYEEKEFECDI